MADEPRRDAEDPEASDGWRLDEDWAAVVVGLALLGLILAEVITNAWVP